MNPDKEATSIFINTYMYGFITVCLHNADRELYLKNWHRTITPRTQCFGHMTCHKIPEGNGAIIQVI